MGGNGTEVGRQKSGQTGGDRKKPRTASMREPGFFGKLPILKFGSDASQEIVLVGHADELVHGFALLEKEQGRNGPDVVLG